jgi:dihydroflavonol-4-reductase
MEITTNNETTVCVTGASGFIASHIVKMLLDDGFKVNATVRSLKDETKLQYLKDMDPNGRLRLFAADLVSEGSYDEAISGCQFVRGSKLPSDNIFSGFTHSISV